MQIPNKSEFYRLWRAGVLGNRPQTFATVEEALASEAPFIGFREVGKAGGGAWELSPRETAHFVAHRWRQEGRQFSLDGAAPNDLTRLCGEVCRTYRGWEGSLAIEPGCSMRAAVALALLTPCSAAKVLYLLDRYMDPSSRDDVDALLDLYPDATVEFSCFSIDVGIIPNRNTIFWEVRNY